MNEIEITMWILNIQLANINWEKSDFDQASIFLITAFQAKVIFVNSLYRNTSIKTIKVIYITQNCALPIQHLKNDWING